MMAGNGWNNWKWLCMAEMAGMAGNCLKWQEMAETDWNV